MSEGIQKVAGSKMRQILRSMTSNRVKGVFTGFIITSLVQSSSATTVLVVSFVNAGLLSLTESIGVIMGANIGTTITAILAALFRSEAAMSLAVAHFLFNTVVVLIFVGIPIIGKLPLYLAERLGLMMQRYRVAAIAYLTLTFFAIPFSLIYFSNGDEVVEQRQQRQKVEVTKD